MKKKKNLGGGWDGLEWAKGQANSPLSTVAHASGSRCKNTSPRRPPTAKLNSNFSLFAAAEIEQNVSKSEQLTI